LGESDGAHGDQTHEGDDDDGVCAEKLNAASEMGVQCLVDDLNERRLNFETVNELTGKICKAQNIYYEISKLKKKAQNVIICLSTTLVR
jgi:hypothetical protein